MLRNVRLWERRLLSVVQGGGGATVPVGTPGFAVGATEVVTGERWPYVETTTNVVGHPGYGIRAVGHAVLKGDAGSAELRRTDGAGV